jgi:hypothetical protein
VPDRRIIGRLKVVFAELWHWEFARGVCDEVSRSLRTSQRLLINLALERHEGMQ